MGHLLVPARPGPIRSDALRLGTGWGGPALLVSLLLVALYLPAHPGSAPGLPTFAALVASLYGAALVLLLLVWGLAIAALAIVPAVVGVAMPTEAFVVAMAAIALGVAAA